MSADAILLGRIARLPRKTGLILGQLSSAGLLSRDTLSVLFEASDLSGGDQRLLAFAIAYGDLRAAGVPVADTLAMARRLGARINLGWSAKRWRAEHDRLSRAVTLKRLGEENMRYDLSNYDRLIDRPFPGYLIRTSRRLGMEGLRQRHCVASYHDRIRAGYCAIAAVFVNRERWTVELRLTGNAAHPLAIGDIRAAFNGAAAESVRETICGYFGVAKDASTGPPQQPGGRPHIFLDTARRVLPVLQASNVARVIVAFDGSGDSGSISDVRFDGGDFDAQTTTVEILSDSHRYEDGRWVGSRAFTRKSVHAAVEDIAYDFLDEAGVDWYNDDGGFGDLVIDVEKGTIALDVSTRHTESSCAYFSERDIATGEPVE